MGGVNGYITGGTLVSLSNKERKEESPSQQFDSLLDEFFGRKHLSWKCFIRSFIISSLVVIILATIAFAISKNVDKYFFAMIIVLSPFTNILPDYVSLLESRIIINYIGKNKNIMLKCFYFLLDMVFSLTIFTIGLIVAFFTVDFNNDIMNKTQVSTIEYLYDTFWDILRLMGEAISFENNILAVYLYSTFTTSIWVWLYVISAMSIRFSSGVKTMIGYLSFLDLKDQPIKVIGVVASIFTFMFAWPLLIVFFY